MRSRSLSFAVAARTVLQPPCHISPLTFGTAFRGKRLRFSGRNAASCPFGHVLLDMRSLGLCPILYYRSVMAAARVLVVDDDPAIRKIIADRMRAQGHEVEVAVDGEAALGAVADFDPELVLLDMKMPKMDGFEVLEALRRTESPPQVVMITAHGNIERAVRAIQLGAADFIPKPFEAAQVDHVVSRVLEAAGLRQRLQRLQTQISDRHTLVRGGSKAMKDALGLAGRAAASNATVLLLGESGSGKEVMARHIHQESPRANEGPFIALNCATLAGDLMESELFGHEKGAFTGAHKSKPGSIELAEGGTLVPRRGRRARCRCAGQAASRPAGAAVSTGRWHQDPRRGHSNRRSDQPRAAQGRRRWRVSRRSLLPSQRRFGSACLRFETGPRTCSHSSSTRLPDTPRTLAAAPLTISEEAWHLLRIYPWPGNVRELNNVIERAAVLAPDDKNRSGRLTRRASRARGAGRARRERRARDSLRLVRRSVPTATRFSKRSGRSFVGRSKKPVATKPRPPTSSACGSPTWRG